MSYQLDPTDVDQIVAALAAVEGLDAVDDEDNPTQVGHLGQPIELPGVVVQAFGYTFDTYGGGYTLRGRLLLVVSDAAAPAAIGALAGLLNQVASVFTPAGEVTHEAVALPNRGAPLPALAVPISVRCTPPSEELAP